MRNRAGITGRSLTGMNEVRYSKVAKAEMPGGCGSVPVRYQCGEMLTTSRRVSGATRNSTGTTKIADRFSVKTGTRLRDEKRLPVFPDLFLVAIMIAIAVSKSRSDS